MATSSSNGSKEIPADLADFIATLDADFGKKKKTDTAAQRNRSFHGQNPSLGSPANTARPNPEDSAAWHPIACITHVVRQRCQTCGNTTEHIGGEFVKFRSIRQFGGEILRRAEVCPDIFLSGRGMISAFGKQTERLLADIVEEHEQSVSRCAGCIAVERQAEELWEKVTQGQMQLDLDLKEDGKIESWNDGTHADSRWQFTKPTKRFPITQGDE